MPDKTPTDQGLSPEALRDYIIRAHGMASGTYFQSNAVMRARIAALLERAIDQDPVMRGFLGRGGPRSDRDAVTGSASLESEHDLAFPGDALEVKPFPGTLPAEFRVALSLLRRPYLPVSDAKVQAIEALGTADLVELPDGRLATWGNADGGWALMPLNAEAAADYRYRAGFPAQSGGGA